jgi:hypothetical protein
VWHHNAGRERVNEYTPTEEKQYKAGGKADVYGRMSGKNSSHSSIKIIERQRKLRKQVWVVRHWAGYSHYMGLKHPQTFGQLAVISPSVWWDDKQILTFVDRLTIRPKVRIWLDICTKEGRDLKDAAEAVANTKLLESALLKKGWHSPTELRYFEAEGAEHNERAWAARFPLILLFVFGRKT